MECKLSPSNEDKKEPTTNTNIIACICSTGSTGRTLFNSTGVCLPPSADHYANTKSCTSFLRDMQASFTSIKHTHHPAPTTLPSPALHGCNNIWSDKLKWLPDVGFINEAWLVPGIARAVTAAVCHTALHYNLLPLACAHTWCPRIQAWSEWSETVCACTSLVREASQPVHSPGCLPYMYTMDLAFASPCIVHMFGATRRKLFHPHRKANHQHHRRRHHRWLLNKANLYRMSLSIAHEK